MIMSTRDSGTLISGVSSPLLPALDWESGVSIVTTSSSSITTRKKTIESEAGDEIEMIFSYGRPWDISSQVVLCQAFPFQPNHKVHAGTTISVRSE